MIQSPPADDCPPDLIPTRASLLGRLKDWNDNASWRDFFDTYWKLIYGFALQRGLTHSEAEEVVQETVLAVAKGIQGFTYDPAKCTFKTWLLTVTRSKIANQYEKRSRRRLRLTPPGKTPNALRCWSACLMTSGKHAGNAPGRRTGKRTSWTPPFSA